MLSSSIAPRTSIACVLSFVTTALAQSIPGASFFNGNGAPGAGSYQLVDDYEPSIFFNKFNFYSSYDPTYGHVQYVTEQVAVQNGYATVSDDNTAVISVDTTNRWPNGGPGRPAVRIISDNTYTHGLFVLDLKHMPYGCGTWPAYWLLGPNWPSNGEIDIIEGVNTISSNTISMHTSDNCSISGSGQTGSFATSNCYEAVNGNSGCGSTLSNTATPHNYGDDLNNNGGGVYITEWTSNYVKHWFFPRNAIPPSITSGMPDPTAFGTPAVNAQGSCMIDDHFANMSIIINTDFCGAWAGQVYEYGYPNCPQNSSAGSSLDSCVDFVGNNPSQFVDAYWEINSIKVYQMPVGAQASASYSTSLSSVTPSATTNTIQRGMGQSTTSVLSSSYSGPLSSVTTTHSSATASATPLICPGSNGSTWTDYHNQDYTIACGSDYNGGSGTFGVYGTISFEACLEVCDSLNGCVGASYIGGNGAGTCYPKQATGLFFYDGSTNAGVRVAGPVSLALSSSTFLSATYQSSTSVISTISSQGLSSPTPTPSASTSTTSSSDAASSTEAGSSAASSSTSVSSTQSSTTSSASPSASVSCPSVDGTVISDSNGKNYTIYCYMDTSGGSISDAIFTEGDFTQCLTGCDSTESCAAWTWVAYTYQGATGGVCYYKDGVRTAISGSDNEVGGILVPSAAPSSTHATSSSTHFATSSSIPLPGSSLTNTMGVSSAHSSSISMANPSSSSHRASTGSNPFGSSSSTQSSTMGSSSSSRMSSSGMGTSTAFSATGSSTIALPCPTSSSQLCATSNEQTTCSSGSGQGYIVTCGMIYTGTVIDTSGIIRRATEPDFHSCQGLCDSTPGCVALNYIGTDCEIFSSVNGTSMYPGAIGATQVIPPYGATTTTSTTNYVMSMSSSTTATSVPSPVCPDSAGKSYTDSGSVVYNLGCYTQYAGNDIGMPISEPSFTDCLPYCDGMSGCVGVEFNFALNLCYLKSSFAGIQTSNTSLIYGRKANAPPGGSVTQTITPTSTLSLASGATVTVVPIITVTSTLPPGGTITSVPSGSYYVYTTSTVSGSGVAPSGNGSASLCYTCALTPTVVTDPGGGGSGPRTCPSLPVIPGTGTVTVYTTQTITSCGLPLTCPAPGYVFGGGASQTGQSVVTTTNRGGQTVIYTEFPTGPGGGGVVTTYPNGGGPGTVTATGTSGSPVTVTGSVTTAQPTCPFSDGALYSDPIGSVYQIMCGVRYSDETLETSSQTTFANCFTACDMYNTLTFYLSSQCLGVTFYSELTVDNCLLESGTTPVKDPGAWSGRLTNPHYSSGNNGTGGNGGTGGTGGTGVMTTTGPALTTYVVSGSTVVATVTAPGGGGGTGGTGGTNGGGGGGGTGGTGGGGGGGQIYVVGGSTYFSTYATVGVSTIAEVSTYISNGQTVLSTYGYTTGPGPTQYGTATLVSGGSTVVSTAVATSYVPSTIYGVSTAFSTYISNGITYVSTYGVSTAISISYIPASTMTVTTTTVSISISNQISTASGPTVTASGDVVTITKGGGGEITVTAPPSVIISYVYPSSTSSSFTCRTYATNYLNGMHGKKVKRTIYAENIMDAQPGARPEP